MPKQTSARNDQNAAGKKGAKRPRIAANGHRLPDPIPRGEILTDVLKRKWKLGKSIGLGGFGEIYLASDDIRKQPGLDAKYVIKVEPHSNGPLFAEMHFYHRVCKSEQIKAWVQKKKLKFLGMPRFIGSGSHEYKGTKYRFMIMERFGEDLQKLLERNNRVFPVKTVYTLGIKILNILEYIHSHGYIHADVKASNLTSGFGKGKENQVHLIDYGLACRYISSQGIHKEYKEDLRKAHDGTIEYTSRDAHIGAHSRRGDLEVLGYNMLQWLSGRLPWENNLKDPEYVSQQKNMYMNNIPLLMKACFPSGLPPRIEEYLTYVANLRFEEAPDYEHCNSMLRAAIRACGYKDDGKLVYISDRCSYPGASRKRQLPRGSESPPRKHKKTELIMTKMPSESSGMLASPGKSLLRVASATTPVQSSKKKSADGDYMSTIDNPTPAMLLVMQRKMEQQQRQAEQRRLKNGFGSNILAKNDTIKNGQVKDKASRTRHTPVNTDKSGSLILNGFHKKGLLQRSSTKGSSLKTKKASVSTGIKLRRQRRRSSTQRL